MPTKILSKSHHLATKDLIKYHQKGAQRKYGGGGGVGSKCLTLCPSLLVAPYGLGTKGLQKSNNIFGTHPDLPQPSVRMLLARVGVSGGVVAADLGPGQTARGVGGRKEGTTEDSGERWGQGDDGRWPCTVLRRPLKTGKKTPPRWVKCTARLHRMRESEPQFRI